MVDLLSASKTYFIKPSKLAIFLRFTKSFEDYLWFIQHICFRGFLWFYVMLDRCPWFTFIYMGAFSCYLC